MRSFENKIFDIKMVDWQVTVSLELLRHRHLSPAPITKIIFDNLYFKSS